MSDYNEISKLNDQDLLKKIKENSDYLSLVYNRCKINSINFMRSMTNGKLNDQFEDIYQDATIVLYEKIAKDDFNLTASFQTYLNSVCRNQLLKKIDKKSLTIVLNDRYEQGDDNFSFLENIADVLEPIEGEIEEKFKAIERALKKIKKAGSHCYELLTLFWYHQKSMIEIADLMGYSNAANTKHQKSRCQKKLKNDVFNILNL